MASSVRLLARKHFCQALRLPTGVDGTRPVVVIPHQVAVGLKRPYGDTKHVHEQRFYQSDPGP